MGASLIGFLIFCNQLLSEPLHFCRLRQKQHASDAKRRGASSRSEIEKPTVKVRLAICSRASPAAFHRNIQMDISQIYDEVFSNAVVIRCIHMNTS
jgi:hypothetical protein